MIVTHPAPREPRLKFVNATSARPMGYWPVSIRKDTAEQLGDVIEFRSAKGTTRGYKVREIGELGTLYDVWIPFNAHETVSGSVHQVLTDDPAPEFIMHPWVNDDIKAIMPNIALRLNKNNPGGYTGDYMIATDENGVPQYDEVKLVRGTATTQTWYLRGKVTSTTTAGKKSGFVAHFWATIRSGSPVIELRALPVWADPENPEPGIGVDAIYFVSGEGVKFDFDVRNQHASQAAYDGSKWWTPIITGSIDFNAQTRGNIGFQDGSGIPLTGRMLCIPQDPTSAVQADVVALDELDNAEFEGIEVDENTQLVADSLELIRAGFQEPIRGIMDDRGWDGHFIGMGHVGRLEPGSSVPMVPDLMGRLSEPAPMGFFQQRHIGITTYPGATGDQEDFGTTKGTLATVFMDPRWINYAMHSVVADCVRGFMYHEADGTPIDPVNHPDWYTWSMGTHWHHGQSPDRLGKNNRVRSDPGTGWSGYDDQHRSQNNLAACFLLTGDDFLEFIIDASSSVDIVNVRYKRDYGFGAARAVGRRALTWANFKMLSADGSESKRRFQALLDWTSTNLPRFFLADQHGNEIQNYNYGRDPRAGLKTPDTNVDVHYWVAWEHALMCYGLLAAHRATGDETHRQYAKRISDTLARFAFFKDSGGWLAIDGMFYPIKNNHYNPADYIPGWTEADVGKPLPAALGRTRGSWAITDRRVGGTAFWTFSAGITTYFATHDPSHDLWDDMVDLARSVTGGREAGQTRHAEWWAVVNSMRATLSRVS